MGYRFPDRTIHIEGEADTDFAGLWIDIRQPRSGAEFMALTRNTWWTDIHSVMAPFILGWNVEGPTNVEVEREAIGKLVPSHTATELTYEVLPAPAVGGPEVFLAVPVEVKNWIHEKLVGSIFPKKDEADEPAKGKRSRSKSRTVPDGQPETTGQTDPDAPQSLPTPSATT